MFVTPIYAAILGLIFVLMSLRTIHLRRQLGLPLGDGDHPKLRRAIRAHGNCAEYVPLCIVLMASLESTGQPESWLHWLGVILVVGRCLHAYGVSQVKENFRFRVSGMFLTFTVILSSSTRILVSHFA